MNEAIRILHARRSVRAYKPDPIPKELLEEIVAAGKAAPSGMNRQAYHITVVQKPEALDALKAAVGGTYEAPCMILVSADASAMTGVHDCDSVMLNMMNAARALEIGSCWLFVYGVKADDPAAQAVYASLGVPEGNKVIVGACFGYPAGEWPEAREKKTDNVNYVL